MVSLSFPFPVVFRPFPEKRSFLLNPFYFCASFILWNGGSLFYLIGLFGIKKSRKDFFASETLKVLTANFLWLIFQEFFGEFSLRFSRHQCPSRISFVFVTFQRAKKWGNDGVLKTFWLFYECCKFFAGKQIISTLSHLWLKVIYYSVGLFYRNW